MSCINSSVDRYTPCLNISSVHSYSLAKKLPKRLSLFSNVFYIAIPDFKILISFRRIIFEYNFFHYFQNTAALTVYTNGSKQIKNFQCKGTICVCAC